VNVHGVKVKAFITQARVAWSIYKFSKTKDSRKFKAESRKFKAESWKLKAESWRMSNFPANCRTNEETAE